MKSSFAYGRRQNEILILRKNRLRHAVTMIELLVVLLIVGILISFLLVAINTVRSSTRSLACMNNLRQLGIALHNYENSWQVLPRPCGRMFAEDYSVWSSLLPHLEQETMVSTIAEVLPFHESIAESPLSIPSILKCPADNHYANYRVNVGARSTASKASGGGGGAFESTGKWLSLSSFTDGLSSTAMASERLSGTNAKSQRSIAMLPTSPYQPDPDQLLAILRSETLGNRRCDIAGSHWFVGDLLHSWYNHVAAPKFRLDGLVARQSREGRPVGGSVAASSAHMQSVNVCMADGSVARWQSNVELSVWRAIGTRDEED